MKIVIIQSGADYESLILCSLLIGLKKKFPDSNIIWLGNPENFDIIKYNKRIKQYHSISNFSFAELDSVFSPDICVNPCSDKKSSEVVSNLFAKSIFGMSKQGPTTRQSDFFFNVLSGQVITNKTIFQLYYSLVDLEWNGEGYGLSYYPRTKQTKQTGVFGSVPNQASMSLPKSVFKKFDTINQYSHIYTDDHFVLHAGLALRKQVSFYSRPLSYRIEFFKSGKHVVI